MARTGTKFAYPPKGYLQLDGGKNNKFQRGLISDNESPDCANVIFENGAVETREGVTKANGTLVAATACMGLYTRHDNTGNQTMLAWFGGTMYGFSVNTFATVPSAQAVFGAENRVGSAEFQGYRFFGDGSATPYKYDGSLFTRHGVPAATGVVSAACNSTGALSGTYQWKISYVNSQVVQGDVGTATATLVISGGQVQLTDIPTGPTSHGVDARRVYRTEDGGSTYKRVGTISDNSTTTYIDNVADASLGVAAPSDNGEPPKYDVAVYHQGRLFCNDPDNPNYVWYSDANEPFTFQSTNFVRVGDNSTDIVRAFAVYQDSIVVFTDTTDWLIYMPSTDESTWLTIRIKAAYGCKSPYAPVVYENKVLFPAMQADKVAGFAAIDGTTTEPSVTFLTVSSAGSDLKSDRIEPDMFLINESKVKHISSIVYKNKVYIAVPHGGSQTTNNRIWVYDFSISRMNKPQEAAWVPFTGLNANQFTVLDGVLYYGSSDDDGFVFKMYDGTFTDNGSAINSYFYTKEFGGNSDHFPNHKDFRTSNLFHEASGSYNMNVTAIIDSDEDGGNALTVDLTPGGNLWGVMDWGDDWGGSKSDKETQLYLGTIAGKRIQFKFDNQNVAGQKFKINGMLFDYNLKGRR